MDIPFTKMQGAGNDFVVIDNRDESLTINGDIARRLADRHFGVGCDQVLVIGPGPDPQADIAYHIFNADGSLAGQCGNGIRCVTRWLADRDALSDGRLSARTITTVLHARLTEFGEIEVNMGVPTLEPADIPVLEASAGEPFVISVDEDQWSMRAVSVGNPHAVLEVADVVQSPVERVGPAIQKSGRFPEGVNVGFMQVKDENHVALRVYERGAGETLACGTGACAAVVAGRVAGNLAESVIVSLPGGDLTVQWRGEGEPVWMGGPADYVFEGSIAL